MALSVRSTQMHEMTKVEKGANLLAVVLPFVATIAAIALLWNQAVGWTALAILFAMYLLAALGITVGYHRLLTHRAFDTSPTFRYTLAILGSMAVQGSVIAWVADHRKHHAFSDDDGDPHSPHGHGPGVSGVLHGLWHAHVGWLLDGHGRADWNRYAPELMEDPTMKRINRAFPLFVGLGLAIPFAAGWLLTGTLAGALAGLLWGGFVRVFFGHHVTWSINSICHFMGTRRFVTDDESRNVFWLSVLSLGESWHHNHHAFPRSAHHGLRWWEIDLSGAVINGLERVGLAHNVVRISRERQEQRRTAGIRQVSRRLATDGPAAGPESPS
jgi:stearoyl-CoA desaturase (Delta-9 desaturase)